LPGVRHFIRRPSLPGVSQSKLKKLLAIKLPFTYNLSISTHKKQGEAINISFKTGYTLRAG
jgi:hypothetical protein